MAARVTRLAVSVAAALMLVLVPTAATAPSAACPKAALPLTRDAVVRSISAVLAREPDESDAMVVSARLAIYDRSARGAQVLRCGRRAFERTVIVYFTRRAYLPAQSASQGVSFVARFGGGYRVWLQAH